MKNTKSISYETLIHINTKPSEVKDTYWLYAERKVGTYPNANKNCGKWLIFVPITHVDDVWLKIKLATEEGKLGSSAKVSTAKPNPNSANPKKSVICVYTYDWTDEADVKRIRQELRELGITSKIPYKADIDTLEGKYANKGDKHISKYYE